MMANSGEASFGSIQNHTILSKVFLGGTLQNHMFLSKTRADILFPYFYYYVAPPRMCSHDRHIWTREQKHTLPGKNIGHLTLIVLSELIWLKTLCICNSCMNKNMGSLNFQTKNEWHFHCQPDHSEKLPPQLALHPQLLRKWMCLQQRRKNSDILFEAWLRSMSCCQTTWSIRRYYLQDLSTVNLLISEPTHYSPLLTKPETVQKSGSINIINRRPVTRNS